MVTGFAAAVLVAACSSTAGDGVQPLPSLTPGPVDSPAETTGNAAVDLASRAALAKDQHYMAVYEWAGAPDDPVEITVTRAEDDSWRVDVPGGAHGGKVDISIVWTKLGYFQCEPVKRKECVNVADPDGRVPAEHDPLVQHPFTDWLDILLDRRNPLAVTFADPPKSGDADSRCFLLERNSVSVDAPIPQTSYCLRDDGTITWVKSSFGTLKLVGELMPAPEQAKLPGDVTDTKPLSTSPPPTKSPSPSPSKTPKDDLRSCLWKLSLGLVRRERWSRCVAVKAEDVPRTGVVRGTFDNADRRTPGRRAAGQQVQRQLLRPAVVLRGGRGQKTASNMV